MLSVLLNNTFLSFQVKANAVCTVIYIFIFIFQAVMLETSETGVSLTDKASGKVIMFITRVNVTSNLCCYSFNTD